METEKYAFSLQGKVGVWVIYTALRSVTLLQNENDLCQNVLFMAENACDESKYSHTPWKFEECLRTVGVVKSLRKFGFKLNYQSANLQASL